jgi:acetyltransferase-like isoleucine patch superfamily enzyme
MHRILAKLARYYEKRQRLNLQKGFKSVGKNFSFDPKSTFINPEKLSIGDNVYINKNAYFSGDITLGNNVMLGPNVTIFAHDHLFGVYGKSIRELAATIIEEAVTIEDEVWIGAYVVILKGVTVGTGAVVGAGVVLNRSVPPYTLAVGSPVRFARKVFSDDKLVTHLQRLGYDCAYAQEVVARRVKMLKGVQLPVVEKDPSTIAS